MSPMVELTHTDCGKPAFLYDGYPERGSKRVSSKAQHLDGTPIEYGSVMCCDSCGEIADQYSLTWPGRRRGDLF